MAARTLDDLRAVLHRIDGRGYKAYRDVEGGWRGEGFALWIDRVQGDPFASPSLVRVRFDQRECQLPAALFATATRRIALEDLLARRAEAAIRRHVKGQRGTGKSGSVRCDAGGQEVLERTAAVVDPDFAELRLSVGLPASGRRVLGREAEALLCEELAEVGERALLWDEAWADEARRFVECVENQEHIRAQLAERKLVAFVADGSILPRRSGVDWKPLVGEGVVPFRSPDSLRVEMELPNPIAWPADPVGAPERSTIAGMAIPEGVTLIVGGGYHGKSTLLKAVERAVYPHIPGDGREYVVARGDLVKIRAEEGRRVERVDISPFISNLPGGRATSDTSAFSSEDASGSTSQAANIMEALEVGTSGLLLDEDTSATNFMVRDARMQALVAASGEPITPFLDRVRELHERLGVSTVLVMGGVGDYFDVADTVIRMSDYAPEDVTDEARRIAAEHPTERRHEAAKPLALPEPRRVDPASLDASRGRRAAHVKLHGMHELVFGRETIDLRALEQLVDPSQTRAIGRAIQRAATEPAARPSTAPSFADERHTGDLAAVRVQEIAAAIFRLRSLRIANQEG